MAPCHFFFEKEKREDNHRELYAGSTSTQKYVTPGCYLVLDANYRALVRSPSISVMEIRLIHFRMYSMNIWLATL